MKKRFAGLLFIMLAVLLSACGAGASNQAPQEPAAGSPSESSSAQSKTVKPLAQDLKLDELNDCTFAASFEAGNAGLNDDGAFVVTMTVYDYQRYDLVDIAQLSKGDTLVIDGENAAVKSIERSGNYVTINGGLEAGGYDLYTEEDGVYYETLMDAGPNYYALGEVTLPVAQDFVFTDNSDPENQGQVFYAGDFLTAMENSADTFPANATVARVAGGQIVEITRNYMP